MYAQKMLNLMKLQSNLANPTAKNAIGIITNVDPDNYLVNVELIAADNDSPAVTTGFIPLVSPWVGNGWGMSCPPNIGDICEVHFQEGQIQSGYASLRFYGLNNLPISNVAPGEFWLLHSSGSFIKLKNDGSITINASAEITLSAPTITLNSETVNIGNGTLKELVTESALTIYNSHTHSDPQGGDTGTPSPQMTSADLTTNVKGS